MRHLSLALVAVVLTAATGFDAAPAIEIRDVPSESGLSAEKLLQLGNQLSDDDRYDEAIKAFTLAVQKDPNNGAALAGRSIAYAASNRLEQAVRDVDEAERLIGGTAKVHNARGLIAMRRGDNTRATAEFTAALKRNPADKWSLYFRASLFQQAHKDVAALADADTYVMAHPTAAEGYILRGRIFRSQQKFAAALLDADRLVRLFPDNAKSLAAAAEIYSGVGDRQRALQAIGRAIAFEPSSYLYRYMRSTYRPWNDFAARKADLNAALELDPGNLDVVAALALIDFKERDWGDAVAGFTAVLARDSKDYGMLAYRSMAQLNLDQRSLAQSDYQSALEFASGPNDLNNICWAYANEGFALDWALDACNRALTIKPDESRFLANRALAELRLGQVDRALADYDQSIASDATEARAYYGRAVVFYGHGKIAAAREDRGRALKLDPRIEETFEKYGLSDLAESMKPH